jgi:hypothetical protein
MKWTIEITRERGGWTRRVVTPGGGVCFAAWGTSTGPHAAGSDVEVLTHQVETAALHVLEAAARAAGLTLELCDFCKLPSGWGNHEH